MAKQYVVGIRENEEGDWFESVETFPNDQQAKKLWEKWRNRFLALHGEKALPAFYQNTRIMKVRN